jgi:hypothetical protein
MVEFQRFQMQVVFQPNRRLLHFQFKSFVIFLLDSTYQFRSAVFWSSGYMEPFFEKYLKRHSKFQNSIFCI